MTNQFLEDVRKGLSSKPKFLFSKYFYDQVGDELFVQIMNLPEYYLTDAEFEIFSQKTGSIIKSLKLDNSEQFELIELGAGNGKKTKELLSVLVNENYNFDYVPVDISQHALDELEQSLKKELPDLSVVKKQGDYFEVLSSFKETKKRKIVLFLGSNIGNLPDDISAKFLYELGGNLKINDRLLLGVDLIKSAEIVLPAYNDRQGITSKFNLNLLSRINRELGGQFDISKFQHQPEYSEKEGIARSFIVSTEKQKVIVEGIGESFDFEKGEKISTEISRKYNDVIIKKIIADTDFELEDKIVDTKNYFANYILTKRSE